MTTEKMKQPMKVVKRCGDCALIPILIKNLDASLSANARIKIDQVKRNILRMSFITIFFPFCKMTNLIGLFMAVLFGISVLASVSGRF